MTEYPTMKDFWAARGFADPAGGMPDPNVDMANNGMVSVPINHSLPSLPFDYEVRAKALDAACGIGGSVEHVLRSATMIHLFLLGKAIAPSRLCYNKAGSALQDFDPDMSDEMASDLAEIAVDTAWSTAFGDIDE